MGLFDKFKIGLGKSSDGLSTGFKNIFSKKKIDENVLTEFEELIITSDAGVEVAKELRKDFENFKVDKKLDDHKEILKLIMADNSPWWVILGDKVDKIQGVVPRERMLAELINGENKKLLSEICEPVDYIPEMIKADQLLTRFDKNHKGVKVVVDEFGGFVGIIGAEAVLSVLAGWWKNKS